MRRVRLRRRSVLVNAVLAAALVTGAGFGYAAVTDEGSSSAVTRTRTGKVARGTVMASVSASGSLSSPSDLGVSFASSGKVTAVQVKVGDKVTAGQVLAEIDPAQAREDLDEAQAAVDVAEANLTKARAGQATGNSAGNSAGGGSGGGSGQTVKALAVTSPTAGATPGAGRSPGHSAGASPGTSGGTRGVTPAPAVTVTVTRTAGAAPSAAASVDAAAVAQAEQALVQARNKLADARRALDGTVLKAPSDGVVASVAGKVGDSVTVSSSGSSSASGGTGGGSGGSQQSGTGSSVPSGFVVLANPSGMQIKVSFSEADAAKVKAGQPAIVTMSVDTSVRLNAKVVSINPLPDSSGSSASAKYSAVVAILGDVSALRTGQAANVQVIVAQADDALYVPAAAVTGTGANASVQIVAAGGTQRRTVTVGVVGDQTTQIVSGLNEGDVVVTGTVTTGGGNGGGSGTSQRTTGGSGTGLTGGAQPPGGAGQFPGPGGNLPGGGAR